MGEKIRKRRKGNQKYQLALKSILLEIFRQWIKEQGLGR